MLIWRTLLRGITSDVMKVISRDVIILERNVAVCITDMKGEEYITMKKAEQVEKYYTTSYITVKTDITDFTLRKYIRLLEDKGLTIQRNEYGHRLYTRQDVAIIESFVNKVKNGESLENATNEVIDNQDDITNEYRQDDENQVANDPEDDETSTELMASNLNNELLQAYLNTENERIELQREQLKIDRERLQIERDNSEMLADILERLDGIDTVTSNYSDIENVDMAEDTARNERNVDSNDLSEDVGKQEDNKKRGFFSKIFGGKK